jgi:hypothetical protein
MMGDARRRALSKEQTATNEAPEQDESYDAADDFSRSIDEAYAAIRERKARGGKGWTPR